MGQKQQKKDGPVAGQQQTLDGLRLQIDAIDDSMHDLLERRAAISVAIAEVKRGAGAGASGPAFRPAREAQILRRLLARDRDQLPASVIVHIWREIIATSLQSQVNFVVHAFTGEDRRDFVDLAHAHFGTRTPVRGHARASQVVTACSEEINAIGIVPLPQAEEVDVPWWGRLSPAGHAGPRVIAKLPFLSDGEDSQSGALAIAAVEQEATGDDTTYLCLETAPGVSRTSLTAMSKAAGFEASLVSAGRTAGGGNGLALLAVRGFVAANDPRLAGLSESEKDVVRRIYPIGGFANPVLVPRGEAAQ